MSAKVLVVDDEGEMAEMVGDYLGDIGYEAEVAVGGKAAVSALRRRQYDAVITDLRMEGIDGLDVLAASQEHDVSRPVILMTAFGSIDGAMDAVRRGAFHYLTKPFKIEEAALCLERALSQQELQRENQRLRRAVEERYSFHNFIGKSPILQQLYDLLERVSPTLAPVLILGEPGTGKELVARAIHQGSPRSSRPFVTVHCAVQAEALLELELFGGQERPIGKPGALVEAEGGTLFLDEIAELPIGLQAKLLRVIETSSVADGAAERKVDVRLVAATNRDLERAVAERRFREDLYYRLHVIPVRLPPLRAHREDIPLLIEHFAERFYTQHPDEPRREFSGEALRRLMEYAWPGNVRELGNTLERLLVLSRHKCIDARDLAQAMPEPLPDAMANLVSEIVPLRVLTRRYVEWVLGQTNGNKLRTAQLLEIDASTIYRMLARDEN